jgi:hypothetical protein
LSGNNGVLEESKRIVDENTRVLQLVQNHPTSGRFPQKQLPFEEMKINPEPANISFIEQPSSVSPHNFSLNSTSTVSVCWFNLVHFYRLISFFYFFRFSLEKPHFIAGLSPLQQIIKIIANLL